VPELETPDGEVVVDSPVILRWLEDRFPDPPLWPRDPAARAWADVFVEWFNGVWKRPPNALTDEPDGPDAPAHAASLARWRDTFEGLLARGPYLLGDALTIADVVAFPFMRYAAADEDPSDTDPFHAVLRHHAAPGPEHERTRAWIARMDALPRA
jgi:glutathione S-transferase